MTTSTTEEDVTATRRDEQKSNARETEQRADAQRADEKQRPDGLRGRDQKAQKPGERSEQTAENADDQAMQLLSDSGEPDVLLDIPVVKVAEISLHVEDLRARVSLSARVGNLVALDVGAEAFLGRLDLTIKGVEAQALLKVRLQKVYALLARTLETIDRNPELLANLLKPVGEAVGAIGRTVEQTVPPLGQAVGSTVEKTVPQVGKAVGDTVEKTVPQVGKAVGDTVEKAAPQVGKAVGDTVEKTVPQVGQAVGSTVEKTGQAVGGTVEKAVPQVEKAVGGTVEKAAPQVEKAVGGAFEKAKQALSSTAEKVAPEVGKAVGTVENAVQEGGAGMASSLKEAAEDIEKATARGDDDRSKHGPTRTARVLRPIKKAAHKCAVKARRAVQTARMVIRVRRQAKTARRVTRHIPSPSGMEAR
jgi:hypothetical protein